MRFDIPSSIVTSLRMYVDFESLFYVDEAYGNYGSDEQGRLVGVTKDLLLLDMMFCIRN